MKSALTSDDFCPNLVGVEAVMQQICKKLTRLIQCAVLTLAAMASINAWGLSLGHITLESTLNQPLRASIVLGKVEGLRPQDVRIGLAQKTAFETMGVDWSGNLSDLDFLAVSSGSGLRIEVSTQAPIVEPYLNFVLELVWPNGRLVREYTVLLDPPVLMAPVRPLDIAAVQAASVRPVIRGPEAPAQRLDEDRITYWGDTLWSIALAARFDSSISVQAMMLAIQSSNPDAFMSKNINRLKAGYVLVMPDQEDLDRISYESAVAEVASQNMEQMLSASQPPPAGSSVDSELVLVAVDVEEPSADSDEALAVPGSAGEKDQLINSATVERNLMAGRLVALETKLESLASTISLRDQRITSLQKQLKTLETLPKVLPEQSFLTPMSISFMVALVMLVVVLLLLSARYQRLTRSLRAASASVVVPESQGSNQAPADAGAQREADFSELGLSELGTLEDIEALNVLKTLKELEDPIELETLDVTDAGGLSEADVASELGIDPDEDPVKMLDLARAYVDMGDSDAARSLLNRVAVIGTPSEASEAQKMLVSLSEG